MTVNVLNQRIQPNSGLYAYSEGSTPGIDPGSPIGTMLPIRDTAGWQIQQATGEAPVYMIGGNPFSRFYQMINAGGTIMMGLDYLACPFFYKWSLPGYTKTNRPTGAYHDFYTTPPGTAIGSGSFQLQGESLHPSGTTKYVRGRNHGATKISTSYAPSGATPFDVTVLGTGDKAATDLAGTKNVNSYKASSMFNGQAFIDGLTITGMPVFSWDFDTGQTVFGGAFNQGVYSSRNAGIMNWGGNMELGIASGGSGPEADFDFSDKAFLQAHRSINCLWADGPLNVMTSFMNIIMPTVLFDAVTVKFGGKNGMSIAEPYHGTYDSTASKDAAYFHGTTVGPYVITTGTNDTFSIKIDAGSTINVVFAAGTYTAAGLAALLNANGTFSAAAVADSFGVSVADGKGFLRVTSKTTGSTSSVQFVTATAQNCSATLGFDNTLITGINAALHIRVYSPSQTAYA